MGQQFYVRFKQLLVDKIDKPSIPTAVALLLCGASLVSNGKQSAGWTFCGIAYRMITDVGCHLGINYVDENDTDTSTSFAVDLEIRKRVYWGAFMTDTFQSLYLGRPSTLDPAKARVPQDLLDSYEELESWSPYIDSSTTPTDSPLLRYQPRPSYALSTFQSLRRLAEIGSRIGSTFYCIESIKQPAERLLTAKLEIEAALDDWSKSLASHLQFDPNTDPTPPPHQITPHTTYWSLVILLERPFLPTGHLSWLDQQRQTSGEQQCAIASLKIWRLVEAYRNAFTLRRAPYFLSYATYCAILVILQQTKEDRHKNLGCLPFFWSAITELQRGCNWGLHKPLKILSTLMKRLGEEAQDTHTAEGSWWNSTTNNETTQNSEFAPENEQTATNSCPFNLFMSGLNGEGVQLLEQLNNIESNVSGDKNWMDVAVGEMGFLDDSLYGLFTPR